MRPKVPLNAAPVPYTGDGSIVYFSNVSNYTHKFITRAGYAGISHRIPIKRTEEPLIVTEPYVLFTPTYGTRAGRDFVPRQVKKFLAHEDNARLLTGVVASGNLNFGSDYAIAGDLISQRFGVPFLARFELMGTPAEINRITKGLDTFWKPQQPSNAASATTTTVP